MKCNDTNFLDFLNRCFEWNPVKRMTPLEALKHPWVLEGLPENYLKYHLKIFNTVENKSIVKEMTLKKIQGFPRDKKEANIYSIV
jgi:dual specificity tyrosine-phosphorylation-regulated kinase 2/3/4